MWTPITLTELYVEIHSTENQLIGELNNFWQLIKIDPTKWKEDQFGVEGGGFWVVAICGQQVIWYNDIEEGFNVSLYKSYGQIDGYWCNQDKLHTAIQKLFYSIKHVSQITGQTSPPINFE